MGAAKSRSLSQEKIAELLAELPPPRQSAAIWLVSCRHLSRTDKFAETTVIFQPDVRLFCGKGHACNNVEENHRSLYIHTSRQALKAGAARCSPIPIVNLPGASLHLPHVTECWALDNEGHRALPASLHGRRVFVWVHGFRKRYFRIINNTSHFAHQLGLRENDSDGACVVGFCWPSHLRKAAYMLARSDAMRAAPRLEGFLRALRRARCRVTVVGHSLGCRVALKALLDDGGAASMDRNVEPLCERLVLLAAAVDASALTNAGAFPRERLQVGSVLVFYSSKDSVLKSTFKIGEAMSGAGVGKTALGLVGAGQACAVESIDVSPSVRGHHPSRWLVCDRVLDALTLGERRNAAVDCEVGEADASQELLWPDSDDDLADEEPQDEDDFLGISG